MRKEDLQELFDIFSTEIFPSVYKEADESDKKTLVYKDGGIYIGSLWMCGRIMVTVSQGEIEEKNYIQMTCMASTDDPRNLFIKSVNGEFYPLLSLLQTAAKPFREGVKVMQHEKLVYAGVRVG